MNIDTCDILDQETIEELIRMKEKQLYLQKHDHKIWQGSNGKWYTYVTRDNQRKLIKRNSLSDLEDAIYTHYYENIYNPTILEIFYLWNDERLSYGEIGNGTHDRYICDYNHYIFDSLLNRMHIRSITENDLELYIRSVLSSKMTAKAYSNLRTIIFGIFKYAKRRKLTNLSITSFFNDLDISKRQFVRTVHTPEESIFTKEETEKLIRYCRAKRSIEYYGLIFAFLTGVRCGELAAIKWDDITGDILHIQRQEILYKGEPGKQVHEVVEYTKTDAGNRYIYLPQQTNNLLLCMRWENRESEWLLAKDGERINKTVFNNILKKACKDCDILPRTMHKIRRTYGTTLIDANVEDSLIMSQMGHSDISTTRKYYYFANKDDDEKRGAINGAVTFGNQ